MTHYLHNFVHFASPATTLVGLLCLFGAPAIAQAQFAAAVAPPRFEIAAEPGKTTREVLEITHAAYGVGKYRLSTNDWRMGADGSLTFDEALQPGSCRPWVSIERKEVTIPKGARLRYRFGVTPPEGTLPMECRFALMIESAQQEVTTGSAKIPMSGRIGVIVYVNVGDARAKLTVLPTEPTDTLSLPGKPDQPVPTLRVRNDGQATARLAGVLSATDARANHVEFTPDSVPILPGTTRSISLQAFEANTPASEPPVRLAWPVSMKGMLEFGAWADAKLDIDRVWSAPPVPPRAPGRNQSALPAEHAASSR